MPDKLYLINLECNSTTTRSLLVCAESLEEARSRAYVFADQPIEKKVMLWYTEELGDLDSFDVAEIIYKE